MGFVKHVPLAVTSSGTGGPVASGGRAVATAAIALSSVAVGAKAVGSRAVVPYARKALPVQMMPVQAQQGWSKIQFPVGHSSSFVPSAIIKAPPKL